MLKSQNPGKGRGYPVQPAMQVRRGQAWIPRWPGWEGAEPGFALRQSVPSSGGISQASELNGKQGAWCHNMKLIVHLIVIILCLPSLGLSERREGGGFPAWGWGKGEEGGLRAWGRCQWRNQEVREEMELTKFSELKIRSVAWARGFLPLHPITNPVRVQVSSLCPCGDSSFPSPPSHPPSLFSPAPPPTSPPHLPFFLSFLLLKAAKPSQNDLWRPKLARGSIPGRKLVTAGGF